MATQVTLNSGSVDSAGSLALKTNGTTTAVTINASQGVEFNAGAVGTPSITTTGDTNTGIFFPAADTIAFSEGGVESMRIDSSGNVGIGTISPSIADFNASAAVLQGNKSDTNGFFFKATSSNTSAVFGAGNNTAFLYTIDSNVLRFGTNSTERARIDTSGNLLVGTTSGSSKFTVLATNASGNTAYIENSSANYTGIGIYSVLTGSGNNNTTAKLFSGYNITNGDVFYVYGNGNVVNYNNSYGALSDAKLKENIVDATPKLADLMQVQVRNYNLIGDTTKQIGVVAQELETVFPSMIDESPDRDAEGNDLGTVTKSVKYSVFVPMLIKALQEQQAIISQLQADVAALKGTA